MRRETRINLIFLAVFLIVVSPGAVILVRKTLRNGSSRLPLPDAVVERMPFMAPPPIPDNVKLIAPDLTMQWLRDFLEGRMPLSALPPGPRWEPVISEDHALQLMDLSRTDHGTQVSLLLWQAPGLPNKGMFKLSVVGHPEHELEITRAEPSDVPQAIRRELVSLGFTRPPQQVVWLEANTSANVSPGDRIELTYPASSGIAHSVVTVPVK